MIAAEWMPLIALALTATFLAAGCSDSRPDSSSSGSGGGGAPDGPVRVRMDTTAGPIVLELDPTKAPTTVANFLDYVRSDFYAGTVFHRVTSGQMRVIQGGGMTTDFQPKPTNDPIRNEAKNGLSNVRGTIAMARTSDPDSATSQFFINVSDNTFLDPDPYRDPHGYAVFGQVVEGMDTVEKIASAPVGPGDRPVDPVIIESASVVED
jgi:cyclophilin family peptidyl-prolyl cis-trans isomerase